MKKVLVAILIIGFIALFSRSLFQRQKITSSDHQSTVAMTMYKDPNCGCCVGYAAVMRRQGYQLKIVKTNNMNQIKQKYGIPPAKQSCHTIVVDRYFIEGHVPMPAVKRLLSERPSINGIGLARMPAGAPGMPGVKRAPYKVYQALNGQFSSYMTI